MGSRWYDYLLPPDGAWRDMLLSLGLAVTLAGVCHTAVAEARYIPSGSMLPTLKIGDRVLIEKLSYHLAQPHRGDIIVFTPPTAVQAYGYDTSVPWIKRVIGVPGDKVSVADGQVWVNGRAIHEDYLEEPPFYAMPERVVPPGNLFVLGDNRNHSIDSHIWGTVPLERVIGRASFRFWPLGHAGNLSDPGSTVAMNQ